MGTIKRFMRYVAVSGGAALSDWIVFASIMALGGHYLNAQMISRIAGGIFSFIANKYWSFEASGADHLHAEGRRFLLLYLVSYGLSVGLLYFFADIVGLNPYVSKLIGDSLIFVFNYLVMNHYVFSGRAGITHRIGQLISRRRTGP
jgi:putative flippase GtrA